MRFESHLGHSVFAVQRPFGFLVLTKLDFLEFSLVYRVLRNRRWIAEFSALPDRVFPLQSPESLCASWSMLRASRSAAGGTHLAQ